MKRIALIQLLLLVNTIGYSQHLSPIFKNFSNNLPSSEVHDIIQDSIGYIWFATDRGVARFDGENTIVLNTEDHFTASVFKFFKETSQKIWINTSDNELYWFNPLDDNHEIHPYIYNNALTTTINKLYKINFIRMLYMKGNSCKVTFLKGTGYVEIDQAGNGKINNRIQVKSQSHKLSNLFINHNSDFSYTEFRHDKDRKSNLSLVSNKGRDTTLLTSLFTFQNLWLYGISDIKHTENETFILVSRYLIKITADKIRYTELPSEGIRLYCDETNVFVGTFNGVLELNKNLKIKESFLEDYSITAILKDHEGGFWFSTIGNGVFYTKNINLISFTNTLTYTPTYLNSKKEFVLLINNNNSLIIYNKKGEEIKSFNSVYQVNNKFTTPNNEIGNYLGPLISHSYDTKLNTYYLNTNRKYFAFSKVLNKIDQDGTVLIHSFSNLPSINDCLLINDSTLILSTKKGLYSYHLKTNKFHTFEIAHDVNVNYKKIETIRSNIFITSNHGLYILKNEELINITLEKNGILDNQLNGIHIQNDTTLWIYSHRGLNKLIFNSNNSNFELKELTTKNGLPTNEIISFSSDSAHLWIGTKKGICRLDKNYSIKSENLSENYFIIDSIFINKEATSNTDTLFANFNSSINLHFKYLAFNKDKTIEFEYQIDTTKWIRTNPDNISLQNLAPGSHSLKVRPYDLTHESQTVLIKTLIISPHFSQLIWFRILIFITFSLILFLIFKIYFNLKSKKKEKELEKLNLELKLLTSQMNPHFTFNTINSIQHFILKNDKREAMAYLSDFALLIRKTLDFSFNDRIPIEEEINFLKLYLNLENKRFEKDFYLETEISDNIEVAIIKIPALLLQPLLENIILHAKYELLDEKKIILSIVDFGQYFNIKIVDYGIGISNHEKLNKHKSYGLEIINGRLKIYNGVNYRGSDLHFDFTDKQHKTGTTVTIKLYKNENNNNR